ncbi:Histone acetyltransferase rtt109 [Neolecta irregularis DAH-3]|uniref:histone acetyltransferase n=1 Tax=Neolecta irregularis (strain DAH-3) TaxID=1198029 RepID=A0A1U7LMR8_NEOID|nr:Histone acetyltransferase rtt109 [Neolecta irregularis DAH-3]|eukprot:OLL23939.1 Histone acetyltransferase rtt109 [Neolecta irregularis DAH-3]
MPNLADAIPLDVCCTRYHLACCSSRPGQPAASHLLLLATAGLLVSAVDVAVYYTPQTTVFYVSKLDSSGYSPCSLTRPLVQTSLRRVLRLHARKGVPNAIALFARAQPQYLFPKSSENPLKNTLDDQSLIKWWLRTLDPFVRSESLISANLLIPGFSPRETDLFLARDNNKWDKGFVFAQMHTAPALHLFANIPRFLDDPKTRFLDELESTGQLSTTSMAAFWELMAERQECASGRVVAFVGVRLSELVEPPPPDIPLYIDEKIYKKAYDSLQYGDFSSKEKAKECTDSWLTGVKSMLGKKSESWGETIQGKKQPSIRNDPDQMVDVLSVRKPIKRDVDTVIANDLANFVRKKSKS